MKRHLSYLVLLAILAVCTACGQADNKSDDAGTTTYKSQNAIYHWKTTFNPTDYEKKFYKEHQIGKMFIRFFDVDIKEDYYHDTITAIPIATTVFKQMPPENMEIIPTVFFTLPGMEVMAEEVKIYASKTLKRIWDMARRYGMENRIHEIQFDCDWTNSTEKAYFSFCKEASRLLAPKGIALSSTVRLHQLTKKAPPVDRATLMLYNTGNFKDINTENSILNYDQACPYINRVDSYPLPLDFAYPTYSWFLLFEGGEFQCIIRDVGSLLEIDQHWEVNDNYLTAKHDLVFGKQEIAKGSVVRVENSDIDQIMRVKALAEDKLKTEGSTVIIYHSDARNLAKYRKDEIDSIYNN